MSTAACQTRPRICWNGASLNLEGAEAGLAVASGMGAITATLWTLVSPGDEIIVDETLYGCTFSFLRHGLAKFGITVQACGPDQSRKTLANMQSARRHAAGLFRDPGQSEHALGRHCGRIADIAHAAWRYRHGRRQHLCHALSHAARSRLAPILVVHSATKYLGGHGDLIRRPGRRPRRADHRDPRPTV